MGNVVVWKPSDSQVFSAQLLLKYSKKQSSWWSYQCSFLEMLKWLQILFLAWFCRIALYRFNSCI
jgi:hypothetical protein